MKYVIVGASLIVLAGSPVAADCGWVLWELKTGEPLALLGRDNEWTISPAVPTFDECKADVTKAVQSVLALTKSEPKPARILTERAVVIYGASGELTLTYICLPGTLDPRPRSAQAK